MKNTQKNNCIPVNIKCWVHKLKPSLARSKTKALVDYSIGTLPTHSKTHTYLLSMWNILFHELPEEHSKEFQLNLSKNRDNNSHNKV